ncbi:MAG: ABC transporter substrate-binding protein [Termitinemataceae bacterium]
MTKLEAGSIVGTSEVAAVREFEQNYPNSPISVQFFDDGWEPVRTKQVYQEIQKKNIDFLVTSHTSTCAVEIAPLINQDQRLTIITGATTSFLSDKDDYILRIIPDLRIEQTTLARKVANRISKNILILRDLANSGYTIPAQEAFISQLITIHPTITIHRYDINTNNLTISELAKLFKSTNPELLYLLIGGYRNNAGNIAQLFYLYHSTTPILFTPWMNSKELVNNAGPAIRNGILPSLFPSRHVSPPVDAYMTAVETRFGFSPTIISLKVYQALEVLHQAFLHKNRSPESVKHWILSQKIIQTSLGSLVFTAFGDLEHPADSNSDIQPYYFIEDMTGEFSIR